MQADSDGASGNEWPQVSGFRFQEEGAVLI